MSRLVLVTTFCLTFQAWANRTNPIPCEDEINKVLESQGLKALNEKDAYDFIQKKTVYSYGGLKSERAVPANILRKLDVLDQQLAAEQEKKELAVRRISELDQSRLEKEAIAYDFESRRFPKKPRIELLPEVAMDFLSEDVNEKDQDLSKLLKQLSKEYVANKVKKNTSMKDQVQLREKIKAHAAKIRQLEDERAELLYSNFRACSKGACSSEFSSEPKEIRELYTEMEALRRKQKEVYIDWNVTSVLYGNLLNLDAKDIRRNAPKTWNQFEKKRRAIGDQLVAIRTKHDDIESKLAEAESRIKGFHSRPDVQVIYEPAEYQSLLVDFSRNTLPQRIAINPLSCRVESVDFSRSEEICASKKLAVQYQKFTSVLNLCKSPATEEANTSAAKPSNAAK